MSTHGHGRAGHGRSAAPAGGRGELATPPACLRWPKSNALDIGGAAALALVLAAIMAVFLVVYFRFFTGEERAS